MFFILDLAVILELQPRYARVLQAALKQIRIAHSSARQVFNLEETPFDVDNPDHEEVTLFSITRNFCFRNFISFGQF